MGSIVSIIAPSTEVSSQRDEPVTLSSLLSSPTLPSPPFICVPGLHNFRDIGGYEIFKDESKSIRRGLVYRGCEPGRITPQGCETLRSLGITRIFDIRGPKEIEGKEALAFSNPELDMKERFIFNVPIGE